MGKETAEKKRAIIAGETVSEKSDLVTTSLESERILTASDMIAVLKRGAIDGKLTDSHLDALAEILILKFEPQAQSWIKEIAQYVLNRPLWQVLLGQFIRNHENGMAQSPIFDPGWDVNYAGQIENAKCEGCGQEFKPQRYGQRFCSNACAVGKIKSPTTTPASPTQGKEPMSEVR